jgi:hypothetical protein
LVELEVPLTAAVAPDAAGPPQQALEGLAVLVGLVEGILLAGVPPHPLMAEAPVARIAF